MTLSDTQFEFLQDVAKLINRAVELQIKITGGELKRTVAQQGIYFAEGKSKTMDSQHLKSLAIDLNFFIRGELTYDKEDIQILGDYWESLNPKNKWGGNWNFVDTPHFQRNL